MIHPLLAGAAAVEITPRQSQFLFGYPHVARYSTGIHDPLLGSALFLSDWQTSLLFLAVDIIFISKALSRRVRERISERAGIPAENILITATHTHSGPITVDYLSNESDTIIPKADQSYLRELEEQLIEAALQAVESAQPAKLGLVLAKSTGIGTNRHDPAGPADHEVPVLLVKSREQDENIACLLVCSMHPTVLHEDSTLISADFPGMARQFLQQEFLGANCPVLHLTGPSGNQSPRHVTLANSFAEAERLGRILGKAVLRVLPTIEYVSEISLNCVLAEIDLPRKAFPAVAAAQENLREVRARFDRLREKRALRQQIRTAECDWFGAEETLTLAQAAANDRLETLYAACLPAEIQLFQIGHWAFVGWPGEIFVDYALTVKGKSRNTFVISLANGELQGYIVTPDAVAAGSYEASNALFSHASGQVLIDTTLRLLAEKQRDNS
jgi:hypothetical protein